MSDQTRDILLAAGRRLDDARDLLDAAMEQTTALERSLREHEYAINDLHWDTAKVLLEPEPSRHALRTVQTAADHLVEQLHHGSIVADRIHDSLSAGGRHLQHTDRLLGALSAASDDPLHAAGVARLTGRADRLNTLVQLATPLADRAHQQLESARQALQDGVTSSAEPSRDQFQRFWSLDRGIFESSRELAHARTSTRDGAELTEHAARSVTLTAAHARDLLRHHPQTPSHYLSPTPRGPSGPTI